MEHRRGRKLGSKNMRSASGLKTRSLSAQNPQEAHLHRQSNYQRSDSTAAVSKCVVESSRQPATTILGDKGLDSRQTPRRDELFSQSPSENLDPALDNNPSYNHGFPEQSPLALLAKTAEARSQGGSVFTPSRTVALANIVRHILAILLFGEML